jgi:ribosomal protein S28E/S33
VRTVRASFSRSISRQSGHIVRPISNTWIDLTLEHAPRLILEAMADCCCPEPKAIADAPACPTCQGASKPVESVTVKALLTPAALRRFQSRDYRFCAAPDCEVVYFAEVEPTFTTGELRERVWQKEPPGQRTICYCFGENEADIRAEVGRTGASQAVERVRAHIAAGRCACEIRNPKGACCLGDVIAAVDRMRMATTGAARSWRDR